MLTEISHWPEGWDCTVDLTSPGQEVTVFSCDRKEPSMIPKSLPDDAIDGIELAAYYADPDLIARTVMHRAFQQYKNYDYRKIMVTREEWKAVANFIGVDVSETPVWNILLLGIPLLWE